MKRTSQHFSKTETSFTRKSSEILLSFSQRLSPKGHD